MIGAALGAVQGLTGVVGGLIGGGKRRREQRRAQAEFNRRKQTFENLDTSNVFTNMENTYEDLTVNQQEAQFVAQQQQQGLANTMDAMQGAAGGSGIAALAQAMANQQSVNAQRAGASIGQQEASNQAAQAQMAGQLQTMERKGELLSREAELNKQSTLLGMSGQRLQAANQARQDATQGLMAGIGGVIGGVAGYRHHTGQGCPRDAALPTDPVFADDGHGDGDTARHLPALDQPLLHPRS